MVDDRMPITRLYGTLGEKLFGVRRGPLAGPSVAGWGGVLQSFKVPTMSSYEKQTMMCSVEAISLSRRKEDFHTKRTILLYSDVLSSVRYSRV